MFGTRIVCIWNCSSRKSVHSPPWWILHHGSRPDIIKLKGRKPFMAYETFSCPSSLSLPLSIFWKHLHILCYHLGISEHKRLVKCNHVAEKRDIFGGRDVVELFRFHGTLISFNLKECQCYNVLIYILVINYSCTYFNSFLCMTPNNRFYFVFGCR